MRVNRAACGPIDTQDACSGGSEAMASLHPPSSGSASQSLPIVSGPIPVLEAKF